MTPLQQHIQKWQGCTKCHLHEGRDKVVFCRGKVPADVLLTGEAPGPSENLLGWPFVGPAGHKLDVIVARVLRTVFGWRGKDEDAFRNDALRLCCCNLTMCIPLDDDGKKFAEPPPEAIVACSARLEELVGIVKPSLIVCVGQLAENWIMGTKGKRHLLRGFGGKLVGIPHPAAVLRAVTVAAKMQLEQRMEVVMSNAFEELRGEVRSQNL